MNAITETRPAQTTAACFHCGEAIPDGCNIGIEIDGEQIRVAFESPMPRGFDTREQALDAAREHIRTQFARIGVDADDVEIITEKQEVETAEPQ